VPRVPVSLSRPTRWERTLSCWKGAGRGHSRGLCRWARAVTGQGQARCNTWAAATAAQLKRHSSHTTQLSCLARPTLPHFDPKDEEMKRDTTTRSTQYCWYTKPRAASPQRTHPGAGKFPLLKHSTSLSPARASHHTLLSKTATFMLGHYPADTAALCHTPSTSRRTGLTS